ncbi:glycosyltransferase [Atlantibacter hermannii]|uniref:glycosyltransferase n=1 Tax=Atlantibacter hermannii TaxID=565 RepID=UPI0019318F97|nr:glycosyltransferase [Atlantibacter hermannii]MBL7675336.1 glycosyltransferase [Atlantibacter hermannii]
MNLYFVVDKLDWAFGKIAHNIKSGLKGYNVSIVCTSDFDTTAEFLKHLQRIITEKAIIHFFWRDYLMEALNYTQQHSEYKKLFVDNIITTHIPDHLFTNEDIINYEKRINLMNFVDGYFVTSRKLAKIYSDQNDFPHPHSIIYDYPAIKINNNSLDVTNDEVTVVWIGNSKWGEYLGYKDYKGLNTVILPALTKLKKEGYLFNFIEFDSYKNKTEHHEILDALARSDILLVSSENEGTPLPLIEAMANGCAIVTTDVGIAKEILPELQKKYIVSREQESFYDSLKYLLDNKEELHQLKQLNQQAFKRSYSEVTDIFDKWTAFFNDVTTKPANEFKEIFLHKAKSPSLYQRMVSKVIYNLSRLALRLNLMNTLKQYKLLRNIYHRMAGSVSNEVDYNLIEPFYQNAISGKEIIAFYSAYWSGVATSTASFFGEESLQYPYYSHEFPQVNGHVYLSRLTEQLSQSPTLKSVIMSGGTQIQMELARRLKEANPAIKVYFAWHGSPAQWVDTSQYNTFEGWLELYRAQKVDGVISFKPGLDDTLNAFDIKAFSVSNFVVSSDTPNKLLAPNSNNYRIGLFAAMFSWYKNPFPQLLAIGSLSGCELITNLHIEKNISWVTENIKLTALAENLNNKRFIRLLARLHVVSYVTNTECSPMIALEAASVGTPCIVGPAGNIYKGFPELESYLVEKEVDNPTSIKNRLILVRDNYNEIKSLLEVFVSEYNRKLEHTKEQLYKELKQ